jgi:hypothetical protein
MSSAWATFTGATCARPSDPSDHWVVHNRHPKYADMVLSKSGTTSGRAHCCALRWRHEMIAASGSGHGRITVAVSSGHGLRMTVRLPQPGQPTPPRRQGVYPPTPTGLQLRTPGFRSSSMSWRNHDPVRHADRPSELPAPRPGPGCQADVPVIPVHATRRTCASARCPGRPPAGGDDDLAAQQDCRDDGKL